MQLTKIVCWHKIKRLATRIHKYFRRQRKVLASRETSLQLPIFVTGKVSLGLILTVADEIALWIDFSDGSLMIAVANGDCENTSSIMINCFRVTVEKRLDTVTLLSLAMPSFFLNSGAGRDIPDLRITNLKWSNNEDSESLLVGSKCASGSFIEMWNLTEKSLPIHSHFKSHFQQPNKAEVFKTLVSWFSISIRFQTLIFLRFIFSLNQIWSHSVNYRYSNRIVDMTTAKTHYGNSSYVYVSMADNTIHCLQRDSLKRVSERFDFLWFCQCSISFRFIYSWQPLHCRVFGALTTIHWPNRVASIMA